MATNVRTFDGTADYIRLATGGADSGFGTYLAVLKRNAGNTGAFLGTHGSGDTDSYQAFIREDTFNVDKLSLGVYGGPSMTTATLSVANGWGIAALTKATGSVATRGHSCVLSGPTWSHANGTSLADFATATEWIIGASFYFAYQADLNADVYCVARWDGNALSDANLETIDGLQAIIDLSPTNLWILDQAATTTAVTDYMGTGADETSLSGTSVTGSVTIPNFSTTIDSGAVVVATPSKMLMGVGL